MIVLINNMIIYYIIAMPDFIYIFALIILIVLCIPKYEPFAVNSNPNPNMSNYKSTYIDFKQ
jgi:hypothetical protein